MSASWSLPIAQRPTVITVSCGWNVRLASLKGTLIALELGNAGPAAHLLPVHPADLADRGEPDHACVIGAVDRQSRHAQATFDVAGGALGGAPVEQDQHGGLGLSGRGREPRAAATRRRPA